VVWESGSGCVNATLDSERMNASQKPEQTLSRVCANCKSLNCKVVRYHLETKNIVHEPRQPIKPV
jgi:hypothetical protein